MRTRKKEDILWIVLVAIQFFCLCLINFCYTEKMLDYDSSLAIRHSVDMWRNHTVFLENFNYTTTLEIDCASFLAAPLYILSGNLSLSLGIVHVFLDSILIGAVYCLLKNLNVDFKFRMIAILLLFTPYEWGQLEYANMIYFSVGQYEFRLICAMLFLALLTYKGSKKNKIFIMGFAIYTFCLFTTVLSSGIYIVIATLAPAVLYEIVIMIRNQKIDLKERTLLITIWAITMAGIALLIAKKMNINIERTELNIVTQEQFVTNFFNAIVGIFLLYGALPHYSTAVVSLTGIAFLTRFIFVVAIFAILLLVKKQYKLFKDKEEYIIRLFIICAVNFFVLIFTYTIYGDSIFESRYHIIWTVILFVSDVMFLSIIYKNESNIWLKRCAMFVILFAVLVMNVSGIRYAVTYSDWKYNQNLSFLETADNMNANTIVVYKDLSTAHVLNALDIDRSVIGIKIVDGEIIQDTWGNFRDRQIETHNMLLVLEEDLDNIPHEFLQQYTEKMIIDNYHIFETYDYTWK